MKKVLSKFFHSSPNWCWIYPWPATSSNYYTASGRIFNPIPEYVMAAAMETESVGSAHFSDITMDWSRGYRLTLHDIHLIPFRQSKNATEVKLFESILKLPCNWWSCRLLPKKAWEKWVGHASRSSRVTSTCSSVFIRALQSRCWREREEKTCNDIVDAKKKKKVPQNRQKIECTRFQPFMAFRPESDS